MAIRTLPSRAIADASIQAVDIANSSISKTKIDADTRLGLQNDSIILDGTDGASANKGDFLTLNGTDGSSTNADDRILFDETFVDKIGLFNINTLGSTGDAVKVNTGGTGLEFGAAGGLVKLVSSTNDGTNPSMTFDLTSATIGTTYKAYKIFGHNLSSFSASNPNLNMFFGTASDTFSTQIQKGGIRNHTDANGANDSISYTSWHRSGQTDTGGAAVAYYVPNTSDHATFEITVFAINDSSVKARYHGHLNFNNSNDYVFTSIINGRFNATTITPYVKFQASSGNYAGTVTVYGIED